MNAQILLSVAAGGAVGAVGRYLAVSGIGHWLGHGFPWGTIAVNIVGSFVLGALVEITALVWSPGEAMRAFFVVGVLGAFTTFSTFSLDVYFLMSRGHMMPALGYVAGSVVFGVAAFFLGMRLLRFVLA